MNPHRHPLLLWSNRLPEPFTLSCVGGWSPGNSGRVSETAECVQGCGWPYVTSPLPDRSSTPPEPPPPPAPRSPHAWPRRFILDKSDSMIVLDKVFKLDVLEPSMVIVISVMAMDHCSLTGLTVREPESTSEPEPLQWVWEGGLRCHFTAGTPVLAF